ncbi:hypothetical protein KZZ52_14615 [Dactylosporangium sp. AC04546]|uniref:hypothetical protein n=1 Tax=Dactylosporangium sp. AC04546 TaxID=2862460 RepID=UPI001EDF0D41|nr:hypothetical protein [Dactylosporangium sp. AC04546]WVK86551.1 hypothetical protein KZZ52_14615 [Dactylosporangium sp. AC04546]
MSGPLILAEFGPAEVSDRVAADLEAGGSQVVTVPLAQLGVAIVFAMTARRLQTKATRRTGTHGPVHAQRGRM